MAVAMNWKPCTSAVRANQHSHGLSFRNAFTLIELLVVIGIIALVAALVPPTLNRSRRFAQYAACKNNLRQAGLALGLYLTDFQKYPSSEYDGWDPWSNLLVDNSSMGPWFRLLPYCGGRSNVLVCPAVPASESWAWLYGYNDDGTGLLGLGGLDLAKKTPVPESFVVLPADMLAYADGGFGWPSGFGWPGWYWLGYHGEFRFNGVFCDGHVEGCRCDRLPHKALQSVPWGQWTPDFNLTKRWNRDNQPHPETWP
jgi:prepilin-type N-terminal cleavage/methylation domain-containing protein/prepilin-type processing-associated H-X9-DG protein